MKNYGHVKKFNIPTVIKSAIQHLLVWIANCHERIALQDRSELKPKGCSEEGKQTALKGAA